MMGCLGSRVVIWKACWLPWLPPGPGEVSRTILPSQ